MWPIPGMTQAKQGQGYQCAGRGGSRAAQPQPGSLGAPALWPRRAEGVLAGISSLQGPSPPASPPQPWPLITTTLPTAGPHVA